MNQFDAARLKIERAVKHISDFESTARSLPDRFTSSTEIDPQGRGKSIKYELVDALKISQEMAVIVGDSIHNLRTALDYVWIGVSHVTTKYTKFPFRSNAQELAAALHGVAIDTTNPALFKWVVDEIKPYPAGNDILCALHDLDITDKHKLLLPVLTSGNVEGILVEDQNGIVEGGTWRIENFALFYIDLLPEVRIHSHGKPCVQVCCGEGSMFEDVEVSEMLSIFRRATVNVIDDLQRFA